MKRMWLALLSVCFFAACGVGVDGEGIDNPHAQKSEAALQNSPSQTPMVPRSNPIALPQDPIPELNERKVRLGTQPAPYRKD